MQLLIVIFLLIFPNFAFANVGLPMLVIIWPLSISAFIPIVIIESWVICRELGISWKMAIIQMSKANLFSTLIGIPFTWGVSVAFEFLLGYVTVNMIGLRSYPPTTIGNIGKVVLTAPWLGPFHEGGYWKVPLAIAVLLPVFFLASFWIEAWLVAHILYPETPAKARIAIWKANLFSYAGIFLSCVIWLGFNTITN